MMEAFAMIASSDEPGTIPPTHVSVLLHNPPEATDVIWAAFIYVVDNPPESKKETIKLKKPIFSLTILYLFFILSFFFRQRC